MINPYDYDYFLPEELIAHTPLKQRDHSKLLVFNRRTGGVEHKHFYDLIDLLDQNHVLVFNDTKVFPARLFGKRSPTGGDVEVLLIRQLSTDSYLAIGRPNLKPGQEIVFSKSLTGLITNRNEDGSVQIQFNQQNTSLLNQIDRLGHTPLPPYISSPLSEKEARSRYQTVYAKHSGSAAAPTAGLHFTNKLLHTLKEKGVQITSITLHVGLGTFQNLRSEQLEKGELHEEYFTINKQTANFLNQAKKQGKQIIAVGTTTVRTLESAINKHGLIIPQTSSTRIFIHPPYQFKFVDSLITNFHLPKSSLLMLVSALTSFPNTDFLFKSFSQSTIGSIYQQAIRNNYRFFSFGDSMYIK